VPRGNVARAGSRESCRYDSPAARWPESMSRGASAHVLRECVKQNNLREQLRTMLARHRQGRETSLADLSGGGGCSAVSRVPSATRHCNGRTAPAPDSNAGSARPAPPRSRGAAYGATTEWNHSGAHGVLARDDTAGSGGDRGGRRRLQYTARAPMQRQARASEESCRRRAAYQAAGPLSAGPQIAHRQSNP
jgi:hypothetical protein